MNRRVVIPLALALGICAALAVGAVLGGAAVYTLTHFRDLPSVAQALSVDEEPGIVISSVDSEGPAAEAGVVRGDILLQIDGQAVDGPVELARVVQGLEPGDQAELTLLHGDEERTLTATVGERDGDPYLGLTPCREFTAQVTLPTVTPGATIVEVMADSPAEEAGLEEGDVIVAVDGQDLGEECALADLIGEHKPGDTVTLEIERPGEESREVAIELGEDPDKEGAPYLGIRYRCLPRVGVFREEWPLDVLPRFRFEEWPFVPPLGEFEQGVILRSVAEDSPAAEAGLEKGDVITAIDGESVEGPQALKEAIAAREPGDSVTLTVYRTDWDEERDIKVTLGEDPEEKGQAYLGVEIAGYFRAGRPEGEEGRRFQFFVPPFHLELPWGEWEFDPEELPHSFEFQWPPTEPEVPPSDVPRFGVRQG